MSRVQSKKIPKNEKQELLNEFWSLVVLLKTREEIENFFRDLLSESETIMLARRIRVAKMLLQEKSYEDISKGMQMSHITIANVHKWLQGRNEDYTQIFPRLVKELEAQKKTKAKKIAQQEVGSFQWIKKRYPLHFLLFNLLDEFSEKPAAKRKK